MRDIKIRYLVEKRQKGGHVLYYWEPTKALRDTGHFLTRRLAERTNRLADAIIEAEILNAELDSWRDGRIPDALRPDTLPWLVKLYRADPVYTELKPKTQDGYEQWIKEILAWSKRAGHPNIKGISRRVVKAFYRSMSDKPAKATAVIRVLRILMRFALEEGLIEENPADIRIKGAKPRNEVWTPEQIEKICTAASSAGYPSIALAVRLGVDIGQRRGDLLQLTWTQYDGRVIKLRQGKTDQPVEVAASPELRAALGETKRISPNILIHETTGRPYRPYTFAHLFRKMARLASLPDNLQFRDLRRTSAVELAEAGCEIHEISAVTGHNLTHSQDIMDVYVPRNSAMARNAVAKRSKHRKRTRKLEV